MTNVVVQNGVDTGGWDDQYLVDDLREGKGNQWPEMIVRWNHICSVLLPDVKIWVRLTSKIDALGRTLLIRRQFSPGSVR